MLRTCKNAAFSLTEVVLAIGIAATVMVALLGLIPSGLSNMQQAAIITTDARILQTLVSKYQLMEWTEVRRGEGRSTQYYFDYHGIELAERSSLDVSFVAQVKVEEAAWLPGATRTNERMRMLQIQIISGNNPKQFNTSRARHHRTQIAQMDSDEKASN